jgi:putative glutamine amidotransferase
VSRPLIAVASVRLESGQIGRWSDSGEAVQSAYLAALRRAKAIPVALGGPDDLDPVELLEAFAGLLLLGGPDVDPACYGAATHPATYGVDPSRDGFEIELVIAARRLGRPLFAICRGHQVLNVAFGGTLEQHLPDQSGLMAHGAPERGGASATHSVAVEGGTRLSELVLGAAALDGCLSSHHQAASVVGNELMVTGRSADGVIEAIEAVEARWWCLGVQWHPERSAAADPAQQALFNGFVAACARNGVSPGRSPAQ